ncbi:MAG: SsrA-binding protein SmpB [Fibromonadaceae bacterium]|jgi:SsrA-binding protein|nr:SsrA-binding protein SmpB [Fibromonadaceae bacterium]
MEKNQRFSAIHNRKASHQYEVLECFEVGLMLVGSEVKSVRAGNISLSESWVDISENGELWLVGAHINEYLQANQFNHIPARRRKLLAHKHEIEKMQKAIEQKGLTIVPLKLYFKKRRAKLEIAICRGKKQHDKRQDLIEKDDKRKVEL